MRFINLALTALVLTALALSPIRPAAAEEQEQLSAEFTKTYRAYNKAYAEGDAERAAELAEKALQLARRDIGSGHPKIAILQLNLAHILILLYRVDEAAPVLEAARKGLIKHHGEDDLNLITVYEDRAKIHASKKEWDKARKELDKAIGVLTRARGPEHTQIAGLMIEQAAVDLAANNIEQAEKMYAQALTIYEKQDGANSVRAAAVLSRQGDLLLLRKDFAAAEQKYLAAHKIYADNLLEDDNIVLASHGRLAKLYIALRDDRFAAHADTIIEHSPNQNGPAVPLFVLRPKYPVFKDGTRPQGWALLEFAVDTKGQVKKPRIVESRPGKLFDQVTLEVAPKWRFKPKVVKGKRVAQNKTRVRLVFRRDNIEVYFGEARFE